MDWSTGSFEGTRDSKFGDGRALFFDSPTGYLSCAGLRGRMLTCVQGFVNHVTRDQNADDNYIVNYHVSNGRDKPMGIAIGSHPNGVTHEEHRQTSQHKPRERRKLAEKQPHKQNKVEKDHNTCV